MNILSTPTAKTRKGTTSRIIRVAGTPTYPKIPTALTTLNNTTMTPMSPTVILACTNSLAGLLLNWPKEMQTYANMRK